MDDKIKYVEAIGQFGDDTTRQYERKIHQFMVDQECQKGVLTDIINSEEDLKIRYGAFYILCTLMRRNKDFTDYRSLLENHRNTFKEMCSINHLESMYLIEVARSSYEFMKALEFSENAVKCNPLNTGYLHSYAINVVKGFEEAYLNLGDGNSENHLNKALQNIKQAIESESTYAKFYATHGRLCTIQGKYRDAKDLINRAIDLENSESRDYALRISDYRAYFLDVTFKEQMSTFNESFTLVKTELERVSLEMEEA